VQARVAHLAFVDDHDRPRVLPVTFAVAADAVWTAIDHKPKRSAEPARVRFLQRRPQAALVVDHYSNDWDQLAWVQLLGRVLILDATDASHGLAALGEKYEQYRATPPAGPVLRLEVERTVHWRARE
jgi:PPOX class probable F420-dependent enzyme